MKLNYVLIALTLYYSPTILAGGADVFSNSDGKIITLFSDGASKTKDQPKSTIRQNKNKLVIKTHIANDTTKNEIAKPN